MNTNEEFIPERTFLSEAVDFSNVDIVCFSHIRWDLNYQRPQHLLSRFAKSNQLFFIEEPLYDALEHQTLQVNSKDDNIWIIVPHLLIGSGGKEAIDAQKELLDKFFFEYKLEDYIFWYYTPLALSFSTHYSPLLIIYDCVNNWSASIVRDNLKLFEAKLFDDSDIIFTGGNSLFEANKNKYANIYSFPGSIDKAHFASARVILEEGEDQKSIPHPILGYFGTIDERFDLELVRKIAALRPLWQLVLIGPVLNIDKDSFPIMENIHFLGSKAYEDLPKYISTWDIALIPFLLNNATKFICPGKATEYLAAGKPVISTPISNIVDSFGKNGLIHIAQTAEEFIKAAELEFDQKRGNDLWFSSVDDFLLGNSWDKTWAKMNDLIKIAFQSKFSSLK